MSEPITANPADWAPMLVSVRDMGTEIYSIDKDGNEWLADGYTLSDVIRLMAGMPIVR